MKSYRGTLLAVAMVLATLSLSGCGDADKWEKTDSIVLSTSTPSVVVRGEAIFTVKSTPPIVATTSADEYACATLLEYRAEGAGLGGGWYQVPGSETTRVWSIDTREAGTLSVVTRGKCAGAKEDWKYSNQVDVSVTEAVVEPPVPPVLPVPTSVTLTTVTATPFDITDNGGLGTAEIIYTLSAVKPSGCTLVLRRLHSGTALTPLNNSPTAADTYHVAPIGAGTATISASGWCTENPSAIVTAAPLDFTVTL